MVNSTLIQNRRGEEAKQGRETVAGIRRSSEMLLTTTAHAAVREGACANNWGSREVPVHSAAWEAEALHRIPRLSAGASEKVSAADTFNAHAMAARGYQSLAQTARARRQTHHRLVDLLETMEAHALPPAGSAHEWGTASLRQSLEHAQAVEQQENYFHDRTHTGLWFADAPHS